MTRPIALLLVVLLWAGIFLPGLGSTELKGEEGRRIMPAVTMLETGDWVVPFVAGKPFLRKPPLVQWCIAGSMSVFGHNEFAARLPSVLGVLALALVMIVATRGWLTTEQSVLAAIILMTQICVVEKGRLAELESVYMSLAGIAMVLWISWWVQGKSPWLTWTVPFVFNGLALLAKAPLHLLFFYAVVAGALIAAKELRRLWSLPHLLGVLIMFGILAAWLVPYFQEVAAGQAGAVWKRQFADRVTGADFELMRLPLNVLDGIANHLPWILFAPLFWRKPIETLSGRDAALIRGARWSVSICFFGLLLIPGVLPRYVQLLAVPFSLMLATLRFEVLPGILRVWWRALGVLVLVVFGALLGFAPMSLTPAVLVALFGLIILLWLEKRSGDTLSVAMAAAGTFILTVIVLTFAPPLVSRSRKGTAEEFYILHGFAAKIQKALPTDQRMVAYGVDDYVPLLATLFYLNQPCDYADNAENISKDARYFLMRAKSRKKFEKYWKVEAELVTLRKEDDDSVLLTAVPREGSQE